MSFLNFTKTAAPSTPAANQVEVYVDTADRKIKTIDDNGVISTLNNDGLQDRNILTNGGFNIQQRVATASTAISGVSTTTRGGVVADRWAVTTSVATNLNWAQIDTNGAQDTNLQSRYYGSIISSTAGKKVMLSQWIIGTEMAHLRGQKVRVSIKHNQKVGTGQTYKLGLLYLTASGTVDVSPAFLTGAWSTTTGVDPAWGTNLSAITPDASPTGEGGTITGAYLNVTTVGTTWTRSSAVFTVPTSAKNLVVVFFSDATGGTTDNISIAEFQLTQGPDIVDYKEPPIAETLLRCQQYYQKTFPVGVVPVQNGGVSGAVRWSNTTAGAVGVLVGNWRFPVKMRVAPTTVTFYNPSNADAFVRNVQKSTNATATSSANASTEGIDINNTGLLGWSVGNELKVHITADCEIVA